MSLHVSLHDVVAAEAHHFTHNGQLHATVTFRDNERREIDIYVAPHVADANVAAFKAATSAPAEAEAAA